MKTEKQYFKDEREKQNKKTKERRIEFKKDILERIADWDYETLKEQYIEKQLSRISYNQALPSRTIWDMLSSTCVICGLEYMYGIQEDYCDDCWEENKHKTLEEINND